MRGFVAKGETWRIPALAVLAVVSAAFFAVYFAGQPPLEQHPFRQTQTALTAYWFTREGYRLIYETPVAGYPWAIPFEFPLYQYIVAGFSQLFGASVSVAGRLVSFAFLLLCLPAVWSINRRLSLPPAVLVLFAALTFSSPLYVFWGRSVMIETTALFLAVAAIKFFLDFLLGGRSLRALSLFAGMMTLCMLQKATTGLPVLMVLCGVFAVAEVARLRAGGALQPARLAAAAVLLLVPLAAGVAWVHLTDVIKSASPLGRSMTSAALTTWNWGTAGQRFSWDFWVTLIWERTFVVNLGNVLGPGVIAACLASRASRQVRSIIACASILGFLPFFLFSNIEIVHDYYQTSSVLFLIYALAVALGAVVLPLKGERITFAFAAVLVASNWIAFGKGYLPKITTTFDRSGRDVAIGEILRRDLPADAQFVAFGNDWSSSFAYLAERKSFTVPAWFKQLAEVVAKPEDFVERDRLGAVVSCTSEAPTLPQLLGWVAGRTGWKVAETHGCAIALPEKRLAATPGNATCLGGIELPEADAGHGEAAPIRLSGWSATGGPRPTAPDDLYLVFSASGKEPVYFQALRVPRLDMSRKLAMPENEDIGFSRLLLPGSLGPGTYSIGIVQVSHGVPVLCTSGSRKLVIQ